MNTYLPRNFSPTLGILVTLSLFFAVPFQARANYQAPVAPVIHAQAPKIFSGSVPHAYAQAPKIAKVKSPSVKVKTPKVRSKAPDVKSKAPKIEARAPKISASAPTPVAFEPKISAEAPLVFTSRPKLYSGSLTIHAFFPFAFSPY